jgi:hypothetical protein
VWVDGDGKGEVLNLQLNNPLHYWPTYDEHYVKVDFTGWRYFELLLRERDAEDYGDYVWPYYDNYGIYRSPLIRGHVSALNLYFNNLPPRESVSCCLSPVKALRTVKATLTNPAVAIGAKRVIFPVALESGSYLEMESASACRLYDERGALVRRVDVRGDVPLLASGKSAVQFACEGPKGRTARAKVTIITCGEPLSASAMHVKPRPVVAGTGGTR